MNCPNDRYVNDAAICQAVAANLARIGVKINLQAETKVSYFPKILRRDTSFYLLGWTPEHGRCARRAVGDHGDAERQGAGQFNLGAYSNPKLDELTLKIQSETDQKKRNDMIREAFKIHQDDVGHIPLHQQALAWAMSNKVEPGAAAEQLHVLQVDHAEVEAAVVARRGCRRAAARPGATCRLRRRRSARRRAAGRASSTATSGIQLPLARRWRSARRRWRWSASSARVFADVVAPHNPFDLATLELSDSMLPPAWMEGGTAKYLLGTDEQGRDILSALMYGARISLFVGGASVLLSMLVGVSLGLLSGFVGGQLDALIMRVCDVMLSFPSILIALLIAGVGRALFPERPRHARLRRADHRHRAAGLGAVRAHGARLDAWSSATRSTCRRRASSASRRCGSCCSTCCPTCMGPVLVLSTIQVATAILTEATLSFLGVGVPPTSPSLGTFINEGNEYLFSGEWWIAIFPGAMLVLIALSINLFGDWLRDALNPRLR